MAPRTLTKYSVFASVAIIFIVSGILSDSGDGLDKDCFAVDGICYRILSDDTVMAYEYDDFLPEIILPSHVVHDGITYAVVDFYIIAHDRFEHIYIPDTVTTLEYRTDIRIVNWIEISPTHPKYTSQDGVIYSKDMSRLIVYPTTKMDSSFTIPEEVTSINKYAFMSNHYLEEVTIGDNIQVIGDCAFMSCNNLKWINRTSIGNTLPEGLLAIGALAFDSTGLEDIHLPDSLRMIGDNAFSYSHIKSLHIGSSVTFIGEYAFGSCSELESVTSDNYRFYVEDNVLFETDASSTQLKLIMYPAGKMDDSYKIPEGVAEIAPYAFEDSVYLEELIFPNSMSTVPTYSLFFAQSIKRIVLSDSILSVEDSACYACSLEEIVWGANVTAIGSSAFEWNYFVDLVIPDTIQSIGDQAFAYNYDLSYVYVPDGVRYMGSKVFLEDFSIENIEFGGSAPHMAGNCLNISDDEYIPFDLHLTVQKEFVLPDRVLNDATTLIIDVQGLLPYPYENLIAALLCALIVVLILRFVKDV
jgi:hypothetical protein